MGKSDRPYSSRELELTLKIMSIEISKNSQTLIEFLNSISRMDEKKEIIKPTVDYILKKVIELSNPDIKKARIYTKIIKDSYKKIYNRKFNPDIGGELNENSTDLLSKYLPKSDWDWN